MYVPGQSQGLRCEEVSITYCRYAAEALIDITSLEIKVPGLQPRIMPFNKPLKDGKDRLMDWCERKQSK